MDAFSSLHILGFFYLFILKGVSSATFTFINSCDYTIWPGILSNAGSQKLETTGFELPKGTSRAIQAPTGWSGRFWARTGCNFDSSGHVTCATGDCGSGQVECNGAGAAPPATLAEFTLGSGTLDFYDVSLVDGYNLPVVVTASGGTGSCGTTGCGVDLNLRCPPELRVGAGEACRSACEAFGKPEYCCRGEYGTPDTCRPSMYSEVFKTACPNSYSYAYDDATSTFTCAGGDYEISFCPAGSTSQKSSEEGAADDSGTGTGTGTGTESESEPEPEGESESGIGGIGIGSGMDISRESGGSAQMMLTDIANLATGDARRRLLLLHQTPFISLFLLLVTLFLL